MTKEAFTKFSDLTSKLLKEVNKNVFKLFYMAQPLDCRNGCSNCNNHELCALNLAKQKDHVTSMEWVEILRTLGVKCVPINASPDEQMEIQETHSNNNSLETYNLTEAMPDTLFEMQHLLVPSRNADV